MREAAATRHDEGSDAAGGDRALVQAARRGDADAFGHLVRRHWTRLVAAARRIVRDHHLAQDVAQEAFLQAHRCLWRLGDHERFRPWLLRIGRNIAVDRVRGSRTRPMVELTEPDLVPESAVGEAPPCDLRDAVVEGARESRDDPHAGAALVDPLELWAAIAAMPPRDRRLMLLRYGRGLSYQQIARECSLTLSVVKIALHRARARLARKLGRAPLLTSRTSAA